MPHELACTLQEAVGIGNFSAAEESNIHVGFEDIDVAEGRVTDARRGLAVMQQLPHVVAAFPHDLEPIPRQLAQFFRLLVQPGLDARIAGSIRQTA